MCLYYKRGEREFFQGELRGAAEELSDGFVVCKG